MERVKHAIRYHHYMFQKKKPNSMHRRERDKFEMKKEYYVDCRNSRFLRDTKIE